MSIKYENESLDNDWNELESLWVSQSNNNKTQVDKEDNELFLQLIKKRGRNEFWGFLLDLLIGLALILFFSNGVYTQITFWDISHLLDAISSIEKTDLFIRELGVDPKDIFAGTMLVVIFCLTFVLIGIVLIYHSLIIRRKTQKFLIDTANFERQIELHFESKIDLAKLTQLIGKYFSISLISLYIINILFFHPIRLPIDWYIFVAQISLLVLFPLSIYWLGRWKTKKEIVQKEKFCKQFLK